MAPNQDYDQNLLNFLTTAYREAVVHKDGYESDVGEVEEKLYRIVTDEDWNKLWDLIQEQEEKYDMELKRIRKFLDTLEDDDILQAKSDEPATRDMDQATAEALKLKLKTMKESEALAYTPEPVSVDSLFELHEEAYEDLGKKFFVIANQGEFDGQISVELTSTKQKFEVMKVYEDKNGELYYKHFGQSNPNKGYNVVTSHTQGFFVYKFIHDNKEYLLFSGEKLNPMRAKVSGTHYKLNDRTEIGENRTLPTNQDVIFCHSAEPAITKMEDEKMEEMKEKIDHDWLASKLLGGWRHPDWFEKMLLAILSVNNENGYPSHLIWYAPPGTGKSYVLESLDRSLDEPAGIHTGEGSTMKGLIPSFKDQPPKEGHMLKAQRVALIDEKFNLLSNSVRNSDSNLQDAFRPLLSLLEHSDRTFSSGNGEVRGLMNSVMIGVGNPSYGIDNMAQAVEKLDEAYLSRCLLYEQTDAHIEYIDERKKTIKDEYETEEEVFPEMDPDFVSLIDTLREDISISVDYERLDRIQEEVESIVPALFVRNIYRARYDHHLENLVCGVAKINTLIEGREEFEARDKDYKQAREILEIIVGSWGDNVDVEEISLASRPYYLKDELRKIYEQVRDQPGISSENIETGARSKGMALERLISLDLIEEFSDKYYPYWHEKVKSENTVKGLIA